MSLFWFFLHFEDKYDYHALLAPKPVTRSAAAAFVPVALAAPSTAPDIRIELRRGAMAITATWPKQAASGGAARI